MSTCHDLEADPAADPLRALARRRSTCGKQILFHRRVGAQAQFQLFLMNADGSGERQLTFPPGINGFPNWGELRGRDRQP